MKENFFTLIQYFRKAKAGLLDDAGKEKLSKALLDPFLNKVYNDWLDDNYVQ